MIFLFFMIFLCFLKTCISPETSFKNWAPRSTKMAPKMTKMLLPKFICYFFNFWHFLTHFWSLRGVKMLRMSQLKLHFLHFFMFLQSGSKMLPKSAKTIKMMTKWHESWRLGGGKKNRKMHISWDIHQKMTPSWGAKEGLQESPKMLPKIIKKVTFAWFYGHFWAPQGGCRSKHLQKVVIF